MPPEIRGRADGSGDVYALGACVAHVFLGSDPAGMPAGGGRLVGLLGLFGHARVGFVVRKLLDTQPEKRPSATAVVQILDDLCGAITSPRPDQSFGSARRRDVKATWCLRVAREAGLATRNFQQNMTPGLAWKSRMFENLATADGINIGGAGVILGLASIDLACGSWDFNEDIMRGAEWLAVRTPSSVAHGFFTGNAGIAVALGVAGRRFGCTEWIHAARARLFEAASVQHDFDLFSGAAGVLWAACLLAEIVEDDDICELAARCGNELIRLAEVRDGLLVWPPIEPGDSPLTGAAHGSAGIALALAVWGRMTRRSEALDLAFETFTRLFRNGRLINGTMLRRVVDGASACAPILPWCHGIAGYLWCMLLAFGDDHRLAPAIDWSLDKCAGARSIGSPVYCHGMAGELELWRSE